MQMDYWGHCKLKLTEIKSRFLRRRETRSTLGKTSQSRGENQEPLTYDVQSGNRTLHFGETVSFIPFFVLEKCQVTAVSPEFPRKKSERARYTRCSLGGHALRGELRKFNL